uniref:Uncharacterized protein n=1 Tax=Romanomermis culicivorax TaxID=13658 RepID=A0A915HQ55_ROMCU
MNQSNKIDDKLKQELLDFLQDLPVMPDDFKSKQSEFWGRQHTETLFRRMLNDREFLQLLIWESIAPKIVDLSNFCCLFSRYTCFKFFERYAGVPFWICCHLMGIPEEEIICFFAVADLRHIFGCKIAQNLFDQLKTCRPNFNLRDFNDLCIKFNRDHCEMRSEKLRADAQLENCKQNLIHFDDFNDLCVKFNRDHCEMRSEKLRADAQLENCKQNLIHFDVNSRQDYGMMECQTSSITYIDPILESDNANTDTTENDDVDLSQQLAECFKNEEDEDEENDDEDAAPATSDVKSRPASWRLENLRKARESRVMLIFQNTSKLILC